MLGSNVFSVFYRKSERQHAANLPASIRAEIDDAMTATSRTDIR